MNTFHCARVRFLLAVATAIALAAHVPSPAAQPSPPPEPQPKPDEQKDDGLARKLLRKAQSGGDEDVMDTIIRLMGEASTNMEVKFDPGPQTQQLQREILAKLDQAIQAAALQRRPMRPPDSGATSDRRRLAETKPGSAKDGDNTKSRGGTGEENAASKAEAAAAAVELPDGELLDPRRAWGHLPARERDELIQGVGEEFLERYRVWVERYYRALQESGDESK